MRDYYLAATVAATDRLNRDLRRFEPSIEHPPAALPDLDDIDAALRWLEAEHATLVTVALTDDGWQLAAALRTFLEQRGYFADWRATHMPGRWRRRPTATASPCSTRNFGALEAWSGEHRAAMDHFAAVLELSPEHPALTGAIHNAMAMRSHLAGDDHAAVEHARLALGVGGRQRPAPSWCVVQPGARVGPPR